MVMLPVCHICGGEISRTSGYPIAQQVTSDCRPWATGGGLAVCEKCGTVQKIVDDHWRRQIGDIYAGYAVYEQGGGAEQVAFEQGTGVSVARSRRIVDWLLGSDTLAAKGSLLDVGCGNGAFLRAFGQSRPEWQMAGLEVHDRNRSQVESIHGVTKLHVGPIERMRGARFDLIVLIHVLEHIPSPVAYLQALGELLTVDGLLLVEVPDLKTSPFDILIADHCSHFDRNTLARAVDMAGFDAVRIEAGECVAKELTLLARPTSSGSTGVPPVARRTAVAAGHIAWLHQLLEQATALRGPVGIFGTSISATWLAAALGDKVGFFVDEDANRIGREHLGRPIFGPADAPKESPVLMPLRPDIALAVARRLSPFGLRFTIPPTAIDTPEEMP
jgi:2-polyprenyl-3-methyl-5-hydroxy-6-metoxy-1,4-benzoquinol methylase